MSSNRLGTAIEGVGRGVAVGVRGSFARLLRGRLIGSISTDVVVVVVPQKKKVAEVEVDLTGHGGGRDVAKSLLGSRRSAGETGNLKGRMALLRNRGVFEAVAGVAVVCRTNDLGRPAD